MDLATDAHGNVYVDDGNNALIQVFTSAGAFITQFGGPGNGHGKFTTAYGVGTDVHGDVYVTDTGNHLIEKFGPLGGGGGSPGSPATTITKAKITGKQGKASFSFKGTHSPKGFQCELIKPTTKHHKKPKATFGRCSSPKTYKHLNPGKYTFEVRAFNAAGTGATATKHFRIKH